MIQLSQIPEWRAGETKQETIDRIRLFHDWQQEILNNEIKARRPSTVEEWRATVEAAFDKEDELRADTVQWLAVASDEAKRTLWEVRKSFIEATLQRLGITPPTP